MPQIQAMPNGRFLHKTKQRWKFALSAGVVLLAGLASRVYRNHLPPILGEFAGDILWACLVFLLVSAFMVQRSLTWRGTTAITISFLIELSQLYHAPWIDAIRHTAFGGLVLGKGFLWSDLLCYALGILGPCSVEWSFCRDQFVASTNNKADRSNQ